MTQNERVLAYIQDFGSISPLEAVADIGCYRLSARIKDLRDMGYNIFSKYETGKNRYGTTTRFCRYFLEEA